MSAGTASTTPPRHRSRCRCPIPRARCRCCRPPPSRAPRRWCRRRPASTPSTSWPRSRWAARPARPRSSSWSGSSDNRPRRCTVSETFHGSWAVEVLSRKAKYERLVISSSTASDGAYLVGAGTVLGVVAGSAWSAAFEWKYPNVGTWQPSAVKKTARYTIDGGLVVVLGADYDDDAHRDSDYADMVVQLTYQAPALAPVQPLPTPFEFTAPREVFVAYRKRHGRHPVRKPVVRPRPRVGPE